MHWGNKAVTAEMPFLACVTAVFKLLASVRYFLHAYHKFKPRSFLTFAPVCNYCRAVQSNFHSAGVLHFKGRRLIPATCVASVLLSSSLTS